MTLTYSAREVRLVGLFLAFFGISMYTFNHRHASPFFRRVLDLVPSAPLRVSSPRLHWEHGFVPETEIWHKISGMTVFKNLYAFNHTFYIVTTDPQSIPERRWILSKGFKAEEHEQNEPDEKTIAIVSPTEARQLFGSFASVMDGVSFIQTDGPQYLRHMYHFVVEVFALWHWRGYTSPELDSMFGGTTRPLPSRWIFPNALRSGLTDKPGMNLWTLRAAVPSLSLEFSDDWENRMNFSRPFVMEYAILGDRFAWRRVPSWKPVGVAFPYEVRKDFWKPIRELVTEFATQPLEFEEPTRPVITYVSRQGPKSGRRLKDEHHDQLVAALEEFARKENYELHITMLEKLDKAEQIRLLSRTTILLGVHGNGLSGQLWLKPSTRTTVIEIFFTTGFLYDYEYTARVLGHKHYGVWFDRYFSYPGLPKEQGPEGFHGSQITVNATLVVELIHRRLTLDDPDQA